MNPKANVNGAPRVDLIRMVENDASELRADEENGRKMVGYPIVFNKKTRIRSWEGDFIEQIAPGALKKTLRENGSNIKVLFNHGMDPAIGNKPLGKPAVQREDDKGLYIEVPLSETSYNEDLITLIRDGAIDGMSFRFSIIQEEWNQKPRKNAANPEGLPERTIKELKLMEYGPVTFPAYEATQVGVRSTHMLDVWQHMSAEDRAEARRLFGLTTGTPDDGAVDSESGEPPTGTRRALTSNQKGYALRAHGVCT
jgi:HK97 family phage prohead protease